MELLEFEPEALLCAPIFNVHGVLVGVFQVITRKILDLSSPAPSPEPLRFSTTPRAAVARRGRSQDSKQRRAFDARDKESFDYICVTAGTALWNLSLAKAHQAMQSRIECLLKLNRNIAAEVSASAVLHQIIAVSYELLRAEHIALYVRDEGTDEFYLFVSEYKDEGVTPVTTPTKGRNKPRGKTSERSQHSQEQVQHAEYDEAFLKAHNGIVGVVIRTGQLVLTNSAPSHVAFDPKFDEMWTSLKTKQVLCAPVKDAGGQILAVVCATNKVDGDEFTADDALYLNYAAEAAGISLHKSNLLRSVLMSQRLTEARLQLAGFVNSNGERAYSSNHGPDDETSATASVARFVRVVMAEGRKLLHCDRFGFLLVDPLKKELWITQEDGQSVRMPLTNGLSGLIATTGKTICTRDAYTHSHFDPTLDRKTGYRTTTVLGMPVFEDHTPINPKIVAVVMAINKKDDNDSGTDKGHDGRRVLRHCVPFTVNDAECMAQYCREIQFALGRLSLDISYYKVVSDCALGTPGEALVDSIDASKTQEQQVSDVNEPEIISSIVQKFCQSSELDALEEVAAAAMADDPDDVEEFDDANENDDGNSDSDEEERVTTPFSATPFPPRSPQRRISTTRENGHVIGVGDVTRWDFSTLDLSSADIYAATSVLFRSLGLLERFQVAQETFSTFLSHVASHYRQNAFHNLQHAFQVTHATYCLLRRSGVAHSYFARVEIFAMLVAALCHDLDHPGNTNDFEVKAHSQLALTHNDDAVLERHHCRVAFIILSHPGANLLARLPTRACFIYMRRLLIHCILATDMAKHFEKCKALEGLSKRHLVVNNNGGRGTRRSRSKHRFVFMAIIIHAADLSGQALPYTQAVRWGMRVLSEFQQQAKNEAELHFPVDSFMTNLHHAKTRVTVQLNFINYVLRPIWLPLATLCPAVRVYADSLESNRERYKAELDKLQREAEIDDLARVYVRESSSRTLVGRPADHQS
ncbi:hypothetical protein DVH05_013588 [Phytophthora capsici]|nr:hypothetical protein DVH05_013588 [Phytophthora capsici]